MGRGLVLYCVDVLGVWLYDGVMGMWGKAFGCGVGVVASVLGGGPRSGVPGGVVLRRHRVAVASRIVNCCMLFGADRVAIGG